MPLTDDEVAEVEEILASVSEIRNKLAPRAREFIDDQCQRYEEFGADMHLTPRQWQWMRDLREQA